MAQSLVERSPITIKRAPGHGFRTRSSAQVPLSKANLSEEINVLFDSGAGRDPENIAGRLHVLGDESLQDVKLKLKLRGWFTSNQTLASRDARNPRKRIMQVLGERELLRNEVLAELSKAADAQDGPKFLHIVVKLADVESVYFNTSSGRELRAGQDSARPRSALTAALANSPKKSVDVESSNLLVRGLVLGEEDGTDKALQRVSSGLSDGTVVHLVVRHTAKVKYSVQGSNFELSISASDTAETVKRRAEAVSGLPFDSHQLLHNGKVLSGRPLAEYGVHKGSVLELVPYEPFIPQPMPEGSPLLSSPDHELFDGFQAARAGLKNGHAPKLASAGTGGSYFIAGADGKPVAVFKPLDEEPCAVNNPKGGFRGLEQGLRRGVRPGEGAVREVAAFLLDHEHFAGVPPTALVSCHTSASPAGADGKVGSLQAYVEAEGDCEERGISHLPAHEVHKIAVLDMRLGNCDRNGGNILVKRGASGAHELVPIDHGYVLPDSFQDISFEWLYWPQARAPLDGAARAYIAALDAERDLLVLAQHGLGIRPECARVLRVLTMLLKKAATRGLTPFHIGSIMCREGMGKSPLEKLHSRATVQTCASSGAGLSAAAEPVYLRHMEQLMEDYLSECVGEHAPCAA